MSKKKSKFSNRVLEKIAQSIGEYFSGNQIRALLHESGIPKTWINYPQTKWRMVVEVFDHCRQNKNGDKKIESIIFAFSHPLNFKEPAHCDMFQSKISDNLFYDNLILLCKNNGECTIEISVTPKEKKEIEEFMNSYVTELTLQDWKRYKDDYKRLIRIVEIFFNDPNALNDNLESAYRNIKQKILYKPPQSIKPFIPFSSLYSAKKDWKKKTEFSIELDSRFCWESISQEIFNSYSQILNGLEKVKAKSGEDGVLSDEQIDSIIKKYPKSKTKSDPIQKMEIIHKMKREENTTAVQRLSDFKSVTFENENLYFDENRIDFVTFRIGKRVLEFLLQKEPFERVDWSEIHEHLTGDDETLDSLEKKGWRKIRDASDAINKKIRKELDLREGDEFIRWDQNQFWKTI